MNNKSMIAGSIALLLVGSSIASEQQATSAGIKSFVMVPVTEPINYEVRNFNYSPSAPSQRKALNETIRKTNPNLGAQLQQHMVSKLSSSGLTEVQGKDIRVDPNDPRKVDYKSIKQNADVIVHVYFDGIGIISTSTMIGATPFQTEYGNFVPFVFVSYCIVIPQLSQKCHLENSGVYGNRTAQDGKMEYRSGSTERWGSFADVEASPKSVFDALANGSVKLGSDIADEVIKLK